MYYFYPGLLLILVWLSWTIINHPITRLHNAVVNRNFLKVKELLESGFDPNINFNGGLTPLYTAIRNGEYDIVTALIDHGADINWGLNNNRTDDYLLTAIECNHTEIVTLLVQQGAEQGIDYYSFIGNEEKITQLLINPGIILLKRNGNTTPLCYAVLGKQKTSIDILIRAGADINKPSFHTDTPLHQAVKIEAIDIVRYLFRYKADIDNINIALHHAARQGHFRIVELLVSKGADINKYIDGLAPIYLSVKSGCLDTTDFLLRNGANVHQKDSFDGSTPIHEATSKKDLLMIELLIHYKANVDSTTYSGGTPLGLSHGYYGYGEIEKLLLQYGATNYGNSD